MPVKRPSPAPARAKVRGGTRALGMPIVAKTQTASILAVLILLLLPGLAPVAQEGAPTATTSVDAEGTVAPAGLQSSAMWISSPPVPAGHDRYLPDVAYNYVRGEHLVVWHNHHPDDHRDIYARRVSQTGQLLSWFAVSVPDTSRPGSRLQPAAAYNAANAQYLVVWAYNPDSLGRGQSIWGRIISWNGSYMWPEFKIAEWPNRTFSHPRVVWNHNRNQYFVVWNAYDAMTGFPTDVSSMLISPTGDLITGRNLTTSTGPHQADVAYNWSSDEYLVVFVRSYSSAATGNDVYGLRVDSDNSVIDGVIPIANTAKHENAPVVVGTASGRYLVVWEYEYSASDHDILGKELNADGTPAGREYFAAGLEDDRWPGLAASFTQDQYLFVWERAAPGGQAIFGWYVGDGINVGEFEVASAVFWDHESPAVAGGRQSYLIAYEGDSSVPTEERHIYGRRYAPYATFLPLVLRAHH